MRAFKNISSLVIQADKPRFDPWAPQESMEALIALVGSSKEKKAEEHKIRKSHLKLTSSGMEMNNVQLILHIGRLLSCIINNIN
jgi:hypothetical protein